MGIFIGAFFGGWLGSYLVHKFLPEWLAFCFLAAAVFMQVKESGSLAVLFGLVLGIGLQYYRSAGRNQRLTGAEIGVGLLGLFAGYSASKALRGDDD